MANPSALRANYADLIGSASLPVLEELFRGSYNQYPGKREMLGKVSKVDSSIAQYTELGDMAAFAAVTEGRDYSFSSIAQGSDKTLEVVKYGLGASFSEECIDDGKFELVSDTLKKMGRAARHAQEQSFFDLLNNGFSGGGTCADGQQLFSTSHVAPGSSSTYSNKLAVDADLSTTSLATAIQMAKENFVGSGGVIYDIPMKYLWCPEELRLYAKELVGSELKPDTSNNNMNSFQGEGLQVLASAHLTDADAWGIASGPEDNGLRIFVRKPLETKAAGPDVGFLNDAIYYKARFREIVAPVHGFGIIGTPGAA